MLPHTKESSRCCCLSCFEEGVLQVDPVSLQCPQPGLAGHPSQVMFDLSTQEENQCVTVSRIAGWLLRQDV